MNKKSLVYVLGCCVLAGGLALPQAAFAKDPCRAAFKGAKGKMRKYEKTNTKAIPKLINLIDKLESKFNQKKAKKDNKIVKFGKKHTQPHVEPDGNQCFVAGYNVEVDDGNGGTKCNPVEAQTTVQPVELCGAATVKMKRNVKKCQANDANEYSPENTYRQITRNCNKAQGNAEDFDRHCQALNDNSCNETCESSGFSLSDLHEACSQ
jgi:hypothetical protein